MLFSIVLIRVFLTGVKRVLGVLSDVVVLRHLWCGSRALSPLTRNKWQPFESPPSNRQPPAGCFVLVTHDTINLCL